MFKISGFQGGSYEGFHLLGYKSGSDRLFLQAAFCLACPTALMTEVPYFSETSVEFQRTARTYPRRTLHITISFIYNFAVSKLHS
jgi:hypothetical protein